MNKALRTLFACFGVWLFAGVALADRATPTLQLVATYDTGLGANGAEIISVRESDGLAVLTNVAGSVDVVDFSDPASPTLLRRVTVDPAFGTPNSAAIHPRHDFFLASPLAITAATPMSRSRKTAPSRVSRSTPAS